MTIKTLGLTLLAATALAACETTGFGPKAPDIVLDRAEASDTEFVEAVLLQETTPASHSIQPTTPTPIRARTFGPQINPQELADIDDVSPVRPHIAIEAANADAAIQPHPDNYLNAVQVYPFTHGALYQVYTAPDQITDIALQPGEQLMSVSSGDTSRWVVGDTISGTGTSAQVHILVMPATSGLKTNLIITTSQRAYHIELHAFRETYMAAVSWRYQDQPLIRNAQTSQSNTGAGTVSTPNGLQLDRLKFRYDITGDEPHWRPVRAFDDGRKVYIQFPGRLDQGEAPPLFVVGRDGQTQLVNYRMRDNYYVVDRLFALAELRLGERRQDVVRIARSDIDGDT